MIGKGDWIYKGAKESHELLLRSYSPLKSLARLMYLKLPVCSLSQYLYMQRKYPTLQILIHKLAHLPSILETDLKHALTETGELNIQGLQGFFLKKKPAEADR